MKIVCLLLGVLFADWARGEDRVLETLEDNLSRAETTLDMVEAQHEIAEYHDKTLTRLEALVRESLDEEAREAFEASSRLFRQYREAESGFAYAFYGGGSMRGLVANSVREQLTRERIKHLRELSPDPPWKE